MEIDEFDVIKSQFDNNQINTICAAIKIIRSPELSSEAASLLQKTIDETPACDETIEDLRAVVKAGESLLFLISDKNILLAAFLGHFIEAEKRYFNVYLLGGDKMELWKDDLLAYLKHFTKTTSSELLLITRKGWKKIYPELKEIGSIYILPGG